MSFFLEIYVFFSPPTMYDVHNIPQLFELIINAIMPLVAYFNDLHYNVKQQLEQAK